MKSFILSCIIFLSFYSFAQTSNIEVLFLDKKHFLLNDQKICLSSDTLKSVKEELDLIPSAVIKIISHTDFRKSEKKNNILTENRARVIYSVLVDLGIDPRRIIPESRGEKEPRKWIDENGKELELTEEYLKVIKKTDKTKYKKLIRLNNRIGVEVIRQDFDPSKETMTIEEAKKKYNYKNYLKY